MDVGGVSVSTGGSSFLRLCFHADTSRWKEALMASERLGVKVVPRSVLLSSHYLQQRLMEPESTCHLQLWTL